ncbi:hypothetical protein Dvar_40610 [Desulfosarcina variabilis str. Montpellier]|uniref:DUF7668 domain-containing protein n=1 Tax=Desulfosarcina variabilis TaxID=2300 RepID=UPI003AFB3F7B
MNVEPIKNLYSLLFEGNYQQIEQITEGIRLNAKEIESAIKDYGKTLVPYPKDVAFDVIKIDANNSEEWSIVAPIYTLEEGLSDLSIELTLIQSGPESFKIELDDIHVR